MKKVFIFSLLMAATLTVQAQIFGLTVDSIGANNAGQGIYDVSFIQGNPLPAGCANRYNYDPNNVPVTLLLTQSYVGGETVRVTLRDEVAEVRNTCNVIGVEAD